jgi:hypothetical protein
MHRLACCLILWSAAAVAQAAGKHEHGVVRLDVALDGATLLIEAEMPLDSLVGFERRPRTEAERKALDAALAKARDGAALFRPPAAAGCTLQRAAADSAALAPGAKASEHADVDAVYEFRCERPAELKSLDHGLFEAFARIKRIEVQVATAGAQSRQVLARPQARLKLAR